MRRLVGSWLMVDEEVVGLWVMFYEEVEDTDIRSGDG